MVIREFWGENKKFSGIFEKNFGRQRRAAADVFGPVARRLVDQNWPARRRRHNDVGARLYTEDT